MVNREQTFKESVKIVADHKIKPGLLISGTVQFSDGVISSWEITKDKDVLFGGVSLEKSGIRISKEEGEYIINEMVRLLCEMNI